MNEAIGDMSEERARLVLLRAVYQMTGEVPVDAVRSADGGYRLSMTVPPEYEENLGRCAECQRLLTANMHRPDMECDDPEAHFRDNPYELHHPFVVNTAEQ